MPLFIFILTLVSQFLNNINPKNAEILTL